MDQHPIPQNVTGFQFKLIGSMTVKQFGYVGAGVIAAVILYYLPLPKGVFSILLKIVLIPIFGATGPILAFVPVDGRPIDVMAGNFMKALFSPNQYVYRKNLKRFSFSTISLSKHLPASQAQQATHSTPKQKMINERGRELQKLLIKSSEHKIRNAQDERENAYLNSILATPSVAPAPAAPKAPISISAPLPQNPASIPLAEGNKPLPPLPAAKPTPQILSEKEEALKKQLEFAKREEATPHDPKSLADIHRKALNLEKQVAEIHSQKLLLEQEIASLKNQLSTKLDPPAIKIDDNPEPQAKPATSSHVRSVPRDMNKSMGFLVSDTPNVVSGMVKDARGNVLANILVEIKDKTGNPVRAFKTNALGNFASATPLAPGAYTIILEDLKKLHTFDAIQITANDQIMLPIEIISYDKREELRKELFSQ